MYNRYIPQPDGSFRRNRIPDPGNPVQPPLPGKPPEPEVPPCPPQTSLPPPAKHPPASGSFLKSLLPPGFDLGDLIVMLLLFLMAGDSQEDRNTAILTMALYFIL